MPTKITFINTVGPGTSDLHLLPIIDRVRRKDVERTVVRLVTGVGGGYGNLVVREQERVLDDVQNDYISAIQEREVRRRRESKYVVYRTHRICHHHGRMVQPREVS